MPFRRILIALDESPVAAHALDVGRQLAVAVGAEVGLLHVIDLRLVAVPDSGVPAATLLEQFRQEGRELLRAAAERVPARRPAWHFLREGRAGAETGATAREWDADLIVIGTHARRGVARLVLGSIAENVIRHAICPVVVVPAPAKHGSP